MRPPNRTAPGALLLMSLGDGDRVLDGKMTGILVPDPNPKPGPQPDPGPDPNRPVPIPGDPVPLPPDQPDIPPVIEPERAPPLATARDPRFSRRT